MQDNEFECLIRDAEMVDIHSPSSNYRGTCMQHEGVAYVHNVPIGPRSSHKYQSTHWVGALASALLASAVWVCGSMRRGLDKGTPHLNPSESPRLPGHWPGSPTGRAIAQNRIQFVVHSAGPRLQVQAESRQDMAKRHYEAMVDECSLQRILEAPVESNGINSPVTVCAPQRAMCQRAPGGNRHHCVLLAEAARIMSRAYLELVRVRFYSFNDIYESQSERVMRYPDQDPMGVLYSAIVAMRYLLSDEILDAHGLDEKVREMLAVVLHMSYKLKTETNWDPGCYANITVLSCFLCKDEIPEHGWDRDWRARDQHVSSMWNIEAQIVCSQPTFRLFDDTPYQALETYLGDAIASNELSEYEARLILGTSFLYLFATALNSERYVLEDMGSECTTADIGRALAAIGVAAIHIAKATAEPTRVHLEKKFTMPTIRNAFLIVSNALNVMATERKTGKGHLSTDKFPLLVSVASISKLSSVLAGMMERDLSVGNNNLY